MLVYHDNYNDHVRIDTVFDTDSLLGKYSELKGVNGNRFFLHFKTLILKEELDERDFLFLNDKHTAKWVIS